MSYSKRIQLAVLASLALHLALLTIPYLPHAEETIGFAAVNEPLVLNLQPESDETAVKRLVEGGVETNETAETSDLISDRTTKAQDASERTSDENRPDTGEISDYDELASRPPDPAIESTATPPSEPPPMASAEPSPETPKEEAVEGAEESTAPDAEKPEAESATDPAPPEPLEAMEPEATLAPESKKTAAEPKREPKPEAAKAETPKAEDAAIDPEPLIDHVLDRYAMAQAPAAAATRLADPGQTRGREGAGAQEKGAVSFEANEHVFGAYMQEIRRRVERKWKSAIQLRYSGAQSTYALIECAIDPRGEIVYVNIKEEGNSATFGALCRQAILDSGPFPPFPFSIPAVYRNRNLEIRWKFSYM